MSFVGFAGQKYLNLETFKKNGDGVKTPVWFAADPSAAKRRSVECSCSTRSISLGSSCWQFSPSSAAAKGSFSRSVRLKPLRDLHLPPAPRSVEMAWANNSQ